MLNKTLLLMLFSVVSSYGQITTTKVPQQVEIADEKPYDGSKNFLGKDVRKYIGEELYLNGKRKGMQYSGYEGFLNNYKKKDILNESNIYKCCDGFHSKYNELTGKYFVVLDVIPHPEASTSEYLYKNVSFLKLEEKESKDIVYFKYNSEYEHSFPFISVRHFNKVRESEKGKKFVIRGFNWSLPDLMVDKNTGKAIEDFTAGSIWECIDITIEEKDFKLALVLKNSKGEEVLLKRMFSQLPSFVFSLESAELYKKKFGSENWTKIVGGNVSLGMTKEMCEVSWGKPKKINRTTTLEGDSEQWVYSDNYLYFDKEILTAIQ
ncbi:hypothetical protein H4K35_14325 [Myroides sp. NP-2]|uniref:hypothetical protein n=1 Tax=Myroides sp. NP-2 TaxID=2759945 RepID=UPI0015FE6CD1|nr:hypothetical protein [Myroides sp. NP-2]MBB1151260.1 hypothetical protein [Myroides sp. NP-2]